MPAGITRQVIADACCEDSMLWYASPQQQCFWANDSSKGSPWLNPQHVLHSMGLCVGLQSLGAAERVCQLAHILQAITTECCSKLASSFVNAAVQYDMSLTAVPLNSQLLPAQLKEHLQIDDQLVVGCCCIVSLWCAVNHWNTSYCIIDSTGQILLLCSIAEYLVGTGSKLPKLLYCCCVVS